LALAGGQINTSARGRIRLLAEILTRNLTKDEIIKT